MIKFHPSAEQLTDFAAGVMLPANALMVSAHCDMCSKCQASVDARTEQMAKIMQSETSSEHTDNKLADMLAEIIAQPRSSSPSAYVSDNRQIELDGRFFTVPRTLARYTQRLGNWSKLVGKIWQAPVEIGGDQVANFIFMENGGRVPEHTHRGNELTLVINGEFSDGLQDYDSGDFIAMNGDDVHQPYSNATEGCLVFTILDKPLHFTSGVARMINPFSHLFFK